MDIFVINLASSEDRLANITAQLEAAHLDFTRISAIDGSSLSPSQLNAHYQSDLNKRTYRRPLSMGEIGCYLSHRNCWQQVVDDKLAMALILEDDAELGNQLPQLLSCIEQLKLAWDIIKLCEPPKQKKIISSVPLVGDFELCRYRKIPSRATGYLISYSGAIKLLEARSSFGRPVDDDIQFHWEFNGNVLGVEPSPIWNAKSSLQSDIDAKGHRQETKNFASAIKAPTLRLSYELNILWHGRKSKKLDATNNSLSSFLRR